MNNDRYDEISSSADFLEYQFTSIGKNGGIEKTVQYKALGFDNIYNLGFGHLNDDGTIDDTVRAKNGDMEKVLTTVAATIYDFTARFPDRKVYLRGSDDIRTRTYQLGIFKNYEEISSDFDVYGHVYTPSSELHEGVSYTEPYEKNKNYYAFIVVRRQ